MKLKRLGYVMRFWREERFVEWERRWRIWRRKCWRL